MFVLKVATALLFLGSLALGAKHGSEAQVSVKLTSNSPNEAKHETQNRTKRQFILTRFELLSLPTGRSNRFLVIPTQQRQSTNTNSNNPVGNIVIQPARIIFQRVLPSVSPAQLQNEFSSARPNQANSQPNAPGFSRPQSTQLVPRLRPNAAIIVPLRGANSQQQALSQSQTPQRVQQVLTQQSRPQQQTQNIQQFFSRPASNRLNSNVLLADQIFRQTEQDRRLRQQQEFLQGQQNLLRPFQEPGSRNFQNSFQNFGFGSLPSPFPRQIQNPQSGFRTQQVELQQRTSNNQAFSRPTSSGNFVSQSLRNPTTILRSFPTSTGGPAVQPTGKQIDTLNLSTRPTQGVQQPTQGVQQPTQGVQQPTLPSPSVAQVVSGVPTTNAISQTGGGTSSQPVISSQQQLNTSPGFSTAQSNFQPQQNTLSPSTSNLRLPSQNIIPATPTSSSFTTSNIGGSRSGANVGVPLPTIPTSNFGGSRSGANVGVPLPTVLSGTSNNSPSILSRGSVTPSFTSQGVGVPLPSPSASNTQASFNRASGQQFFIRPESREIFDTREILSSREFFDTREVLDSREFFDSRERFRSRELFDTRAILSGESPGVLNRRPIFRSSVSDFDVTDEVISSEVFFRGRK